MRAGADIQQVHADRDEFNWTDQERSVMKNSLTFLGRLCPSWVGQYAKKKKNAVNWKRCIHNK